ncbi:hypothetical protein FA13DRAFT_1715790 [Coprinellus micaceus]|uniref:Uncharacterized protein n=1 Tax=Coprinellus micaceus TaxID=71717 RepID=A0A4Y7SMJ8_COPMI|nr:hypothetical protein FA13DRAFT_1715790 [Coprinellus micaceus]
MSLALSPYRIDSTPKLASDMTNDATNKAPTAPTTPVQTHYRNVLTTRSGRHLRPLRLSGPALSPSAFISPRRPLGVCTGGFTTQGRCTPLGKCDRGSDDKESCDSTKVTSATGLGVHSDPCHPIVEPEGLEFDAQYLKACKLIPFNPKTQGLSNLNVLFALARVFGPGITRSPDLSSGKSCASAAYAATFALSSGMDITSAEARF